MKTTAQNGDVQIATETFGNPDDPPILLIMGTMASMLWWPDEFVQRLADAGRHVIRFDHRDTGLSTTWPPGEAHYAVADMANDAGAVITALGLASAHIVGMSLGGLIGQVMAARTPKTVTSLTLISTTPLGVPNLPPPTEAFKVHAATGAKVDWRDRASATDFMLRNALVLGSPHRSHDVAAIRTFIERDFDRSPSFASVVNHAAAQQTAGTDGAGAADITRPTLVIHGTLDPLFPPAHAEASAAIIPGAELIWIERGGHELHSADWPRMIASIFDFTRRTDPYDG